MRIKFSYTPQSGLRDYVSLEAEGKNILAKYKMLEETFHELLRTLNIIRKNKTQK